MSNSARGDRLSRRHRNGAQKTVLGGEDRQAHIRRERRARDGLLACARRTIFGLRGVELGCGLFDRAFARRAITQQLGQAVDPSARERHTRLGRRLLTLCLRAQVAIDRRDRREPQEHVAARHGSARAQRCRSGAQGA
jgi:hypothetical protein